MVQPEQARRLQTSGQAACCVAAIFIAKAEVGCGEEASSQEGGQDLRGPEPDAARMVRHTHIQTAKILISISKNWPFFKSVSILYILVLIVM